MINQFEKLYLPFTNTARKYGYIIWKKKYDDNMKRILGNKETINLQIGNIIQKSKKVDWKKRRISIKYTLTRSVPEEINCMKLEKIEINKVLVSFLKKDY